MKQNILCNSTGPAMHPKVTENLVSSVLVDQYWHSTLADANEDLSGTVLLPLATLCSHCKGA